MSLPRIVLPFALGYFLSYLYRSVNAVVAPDLIRAFGLDAWTIGFLTSAYFLSFGAAQIPLGIALDRFGPRRTEAFLLLFAAVGAVFFARAEGAPGLILGRALIGLGVSACLMASFKAFVLFAPLERLPFLNGCVLASGALGAVAATVPVEWTLRITDWRVLFLSLGALTLGVAGLLFFSMPEAREGEGHGSLASAFRGVREVFTSRAFWSVAPAGTVIQAAYLSVQGLWAGPWLRDVAGLPRLQAAHHLLAMAAAMAVGYLTLGALTERLGRRGISPLAVASGGMSLFVLVQAAIVMERVELALPLWFGFGFFGTAGTLNYVVLTNRFPPEMAGRVNTSLNLLLFVGAFATQAGIGAVIELWPPSRSGGFAPAGYQAAFGLVFLAEVLALGWFLYANRGGAGFSSRAEETCGTRRKHVPHN
ncbi:MAG: MFS transporter [Acidobacteriota bacterium]